MKKLEIDINNLRERINNALEESGWTPALAPFINGLSFDIILNSLVFGGLQKNLILEN